jgi:lipoprotein-releasing system ATP-binding protein
MSSDPVLTLDAVERVYVSGEHRLAVLRGAELALWSGQSVALIAPSGTGKSTLLHVAGLLERPDRGEIIVSGVATASLSDAARTSLRRTEIGFVYQFHHLLPEFSAVENVMMPQMIRGLTKKEARSRAMELLDYLGIGARAAHRPGELSGGEQQRVAIARAVVNGPRLLLADEPTGNLDPGTADHVFAAMTQLVRATGLAALVATHNMEIAGRMDRCVTLQDGRLIEVEPPRFED